MAPFLSMRYPVDEDDQKAYPYLLIFKLNEPGCLTFYNVCKEEYFNGSHIQEFRTSKQISPASDGWMAPIGLDSPADCCLYNLSSKAKIKLPKIPRDEDSTNTFYSCTFSKPPTDLQCRFLFISANEGHLLVCRRGAERFRRRSIRVRDDHLSAITNFNGTLFAYMGASRRIAELEFVGRGGLNGKLLVNNEGRFCKVEPPSPRCLLHEVNFLLDCCGELVLVQQFNYLHTKKLAHFRLFKVDDISEKSCSELLDIGDKAIFLCPTGSMALSTHEFPELRPNSIYYVWGHKPHCLHVQYRRQGKNRGETMQ